MLNTEPAHAGQKDGKKTRQRKIRVCTECRKRKQRCDQAWPCHNCTRRYPPVLCTYADSRNPNNKHNPNSEKLVQLGGDPQAGDGFTPQATQNVARRPGSTASIIIPLHETRQPPIARDPSTTGPSALMRRENGWGATSFRKDPTKMEHLPPEYVFGGSDILNVFRVDQSSPFYPLRDSLPTPNVRVMIVKVRDVAIEPLHYLPIEPSRRNAELLHFFLQKLSSFMSTIDGKDPPEDFMARWLSFMIQSPFMIHITILAAAYFQAVTNNIDVKKSVDVAIAKVNLISLINDHITSNSKGVDDEAIAAVMSLAYNELIYADKRSTLGHMIGLREMIRTRGGLENVRLSELRVMLMRTDYQVACTLECDPIIQGVQEATILMAYPIQLDSPLLVSSNLFVDSIDFHSINTATATILDDMRFITTSIMTLSGAEHPELAKVKFLATVRWIHQRLTSEKPEAHLANDFVYQTCRATAIIYTTAVLSGQPFSEACTSELLQNVWRVMWRVPLPRWKQIPGVFFWVVLVANPFARNRPEGRFLKGVIAGNTVAMGLADWDATTAILKTFLALQRWLGGKDLESSIILDNRLGISRSPEGGLPAWALTQNVLNAKFSEKQYESVFTRSPGSCASLLFWLPTAIRGFLEDEYIYDREIASFLAAMEIQILEEVIDHSLRRPKLQAIIFQDLPRQLWPTAFGGCTCIPKEEDVYGDVFAFLRETRVTQLAVPPTYLKLFSPQQASSTPDLQAIVVASELVHGDLIASWAPHVRFNIAYGPTETFYSAITPTLKATDNIMGLIGEPIACRYWLANIEDPEVLAQDGELAETRSVFIENPSWAKATHGEKPRRFFLTGDLVKRQADGRRLACGRKDTQVKINGWPVAVQKIDSSILDSKLVAFVATGSPESDKSTAPQVQWQTVEALSLIFQETKNFLAAILPARMIPAFFVPLSHLPIVTANGKLSRQVLVSMGERFDRQEVDILLEAAREHRPSPTGAINGLPKSEVPQLSDMEVQLRMLWTEALQFSTEIWPSDNFLALGGDSIAAVRLSVAANRQGLKLRVADILRNPILRDMAVKVQPLPPRDLAANGTSVGPFSVMGGREDSSVQALISQAAAMSGHQEPDVLDIFPAISDRPYMIMQSISSPEAFVSTLTFDLPVDLDFDRFKKAWESTFELADILRTRYIPWEQKGFVCVTFQEDFVLTTHDNLNSLLVEKKKSVALTIDTIKQFYYGETPAPFVPFRNFVQSVLSADTEGNSSIWVQKLAGGTAASFPALVGPNGPKMPVASEVETHNISIPRNLQSDIMTTTIIRAALGLTVAHMSNPGTHDVLFIEGWSGRDVMIDHDPDRILGPTMFPGGTRINFEAEQSVNSFLKDVQEDNLELIQHMSIELPMLQAALNPFPRVGLNIEHASSVAWSNGLFEFVSETAHGICRVGIPLSVICRFDDESITKIELHYDPDLIPKTKLHEFLQLYKAYMSELSQPLNRGVAISELQRKMSDEDHLRTD
ncbi:uncharacterized protein BP5553_08890 [Venustampulla echinocandica]|uniref:Zn(2)-C6 fungal-type domain-containing protein n=1 Tax=Venustampulla echinocandica TaxID=2656787 RepID=A0A370TDC7_9HELO|nr:uncharacterized protein BP5553_08890 [Venustampulla echinocandica]RDL32434.1 hypothetical protein BP5553_08890 [Venustampulla echinocandica]